MQDAAEDQQDRRHDADFRVNRQTADGGTGKADQDNSGEERNLAAVPVADAPEEQPAERTDNESKAEYGQRGQKRDGRVVARKEFRGHTRGTIAINGKIIIFEEGSKRGCCRGFFGFGQFVGIVRFRSVNGVSHFYNSS